MAKCRVIGLHSGTSMDALDVAAAELRLHGDEIELEPLGHDELPYPERLRAELADPSRSREAGPETWCRIDTGLGRALADAARHGIAELANGRADLVVSLGQTAHHLVDDRGRARGTLQLGQPAWIAEETGLPVVSDLRSRDIAAGGQGAPLAALFDALWLRGLHRDPPDASGTEREAPSTATTLNIGGIANITVDGPRGVLAYDTGPGNALIDAAAAMVTDERTSDVDGELAAAGRVRDDLLGALLADEYYSTPPPKSTGKERFNAEYLRTRLSVLPPIDGQDLLATVTALTARTVAQECAGHASRFVIASGGGIANPVLLDALRTELAHRDVELRTSEHHGIPSGGKEAYLTAVLGFLAVHGVAGNHPAATGAAGPRVLGSITPGHEPLRLPAPADAPVNALRVLPRENVLAEKDQEPACAPSTSR
ncbi:anhydro-N-acetylmuramic acid kinase [Actinopolyspora saharensis]|nr:anhydro-N-acetylmuramic acid kinase [Actinopolyspora saharensis]